jgi:hypothetical protein
MSKARITIDLTADGELEIWLNEAGRDLLVSELQKLNERSDHFHLGPAPVGEVEVCSRGYRADDQVLQFGKVLFRTDDWDRQYYPHVFDSNSE